MKTPRRHGFTVVELVIVVIVVAILATLAITTYTRVQAEARDKKRQTDILNVMNELDKYYDKNGTYPLGCNLSTYAASDCPSKIASYASSGYGTPPPTIGQSTSLNSIRSFLPGLSASFGDPSNTTSTPFNQHHSSDPSFIQTGSYFFLSQDTLNISEGAALATNATASTSIGCGASPYQYNYSGVSTGNRPHPYVLGYFSEVEKKWVFYHGPKLDSLNDLRWNYNAKPECTPAN